METKARKTAGPKRNHFLPISYQARFARGGTLAVYDAKTKNIRQQTPVNTGVEKDLYTIKLEGEKVDKTMETMFSMIEGATKSSIDALIAGNTIDATQREEIAFFVALLAARTPDMIEGLRKSMNTAETLAMRTLWNERGRSAMIEEGYTAKEIEEIQQEISRGEITVQAPEGWALMMGIAVAPDITPVLRERQWVVLHGKSRKSGFVTSDVPVMLTSKRKRPKGLGQQSVGFAQEDAVVILPLSNDAALVAQDAGGKTEHRTIGQRRVDEVNCLMAANFQRFALGRNEAMMKRWAKENNYPTVREKGDRLEVNELTMNGRDGSGEPDKVLHMTTAQHRVLRPFLLR